MTNLKEQFEKVLNKYFYKNNTSDPYDNGWSYKNDCSVAFCHDDYVVCYFELDEEQVIAGNFDTTYHNEKQITTPEELEVAIQKFLTSEKELIKRHRLKLIEEL